MTNEEMLDRQEIAVLLARYNSEGDRGNVEGLASVFTEDGVLDTGTGLRAEGRIAIADMLSGRHPARAAATGRRPMFVRHYLSSSLVTFDGPDSARGRAYYLVITDIGPDHSGTYTDHYVRRDGAWAIAHRRSRIDWAAPESNMTATRPAAPAGGAR